MSHLINETCTSNKDQLVKYLGSLQYESSHNKTVKYCQDDPECFVFLQQSREDLVPDCEDF